jgi:hypothetical protein
MAFILLKAVCPVSGEPLFTALNKNHFSTLVKSPVSYVSMCYAISQALQKNS